MSACGECKFFDRAYDIANYGLCRVNPPRMDSEQVAVWPQVIVTDWCGAFSPHAPGFTEQGATDD